MNRLLVASLSFALLMAPAHAPAMAFDAPSASLSGELDGEVRVQKAKLIYSSWGGKEYDNSFPPVQWPRPLEVGSDKPLTIRIGTHQLPEVVEVRMWRRLRANGIPRGKPRLLACFLVAMPGKCSIAPAASSTGLGWSVSFEVPWRGRAYLATMADWGDAQVAWINHIFVR